MTATNQAIDLLLRNVRIVTCADDEGSVTSAAFVAVLGGKIAGLGPMAQLDPQVRALREIDAQGALLTPGLIDCHTHLVYAGQRAREFEMRLQGVRANAVSPGPAKTARFLATRETDPAMMEEGPSLERYAAPSEIADAVAFLAGPDSRFITGQTLRIDGGLTPYAG